jgi:sugar phosphate isomerase/epimerase
MRIGFYTSTFNDRPIEEVLDFARASGFDAVEIDVGGHIKSPDKVGSVAAAARDRGLIVSSIALFGNQLDPDPKKREALRKLTADYVSATADAGVPILVVFPGRDPTVSEDANYRDSADYVNNLLALPRGAVLTIAIENWPGPNDDFIATTPDGWEKLGALVPNLRFGLEFDPSHLLRLGVDPYVAFDEVKHRIKILHAKDTAINPARLQQVGYHGQGWWRYVLPGLGMLDWTKFLRQARDAGYDGVVSVEHEDAEFGWPGKSLDSRKEGERRALAYLRETLAGL